QFECEIFELKAELNNEKKEKRKEAVKKVIAAMTVGKDVRFFDSLITITQSNMQSYCPYCVKDDLRASGSQSVGRTSIAGGARAISRKRKEIKR
uniref:Uncharacterized protein n=1 Tax=Sinocyclocheilus rhinocerous TaxID=307959 RepID=A0A673G642_9TELE